MKSSSCVCFKRYQARCILYWPVLLVLACCCIVNFSIRISSNYQGNTTMDLISSLSDIDGYNFESNQVYVYIMTIVAVLVWAGSGFFSAWLAGWKYKLHSIIMIGMVIMSAGVFLDNVISLLSLAMANSGSSV